MAQNSQTEHEMTLTMNSLQQQQMMMAISPRTLENESLGNCSVGNDSFGGDAMSFEDKNGGKDKSNADSPSVSFNRRGNYGNARKGHGPLAPGMGKVINHTRHKQHDPQLQ